MKIINYLLLTIFSISLNSCKNNNPELPFKIGDPSTEIINKKDELTNYLEFHSFIFFTYDNFDVVIYNENNYINKIKMYETKIATQRNYKKLKRDSDMYNIIELLGVPFSYYNNLDDNLLFKNDNNGVYLVSFMYVTNEKVRIGFVCEL